MQKKGLIICRIDGNCLIHTWDRIKKEFVAPNQIDNCSLHTEDDFIEALQKYKDSPQPKSIYFLTN